MKKFLLMLCGVAMLTFGGMVTQSDAAAPRVVVNRGLRQGARSVNYVARRVGVPVRVAPARIAPRYGAGYYGARNYGVRNYGAGYYRGYYGW